jgi:hypothetical protein
MKINWDQNDHKPKAPLLAKTREMWHPLLEGYFGNGDVGPLAITNTVGTAAAKIV